MSTPEDADHTSEMAHDDNTSNLDSAQLDTSVSVQKESKSSVEVENFIETNKVMPYGIDYKLKKAVSNKRFFERKPDRKSRKEWSDVEIFFLKKGIAMYGAGNWKKILDTYKKFFHESRRPQDLKDKNRVMIKKNPSIACKPNVDYIEVDEHSKAIDTQVYSKPYPNEVAYVIASVKRIDEMIIRIAAKDSFCETLGKYTKVFEYFVNVVEGILTVKRIAERRKP